jgi:hypothetical protein
MARFILVHGMFHGGWCWDRIERQLPIEAQRAMIARSKPTEVHSLDADHMPIFNDVDRLTELLESIAGRFT